MKRKKIFRTIIGIFLVAFLICACVWLFFAFKKEFKTTNYKKNIVVGYKEKFKEKPGGVCYGNLFKCTKAKYKFNGKVDTSKIGKYNVSYEYSSSGKKLKLKQKVEVKDIKAPELKIENDKVLVCPKSFKIYDLKMSALDDLDGDLTKEIKTKFIDNSKEKNKKSIVSISVEDKAGNKNIKELDALVEDKKAPELKLNGSDTIYVVIGGNYEDEGATAKDNCDEEIKVETSNDINYKSAGTYTIKYSAKDSSGNEASIERKVVVRANETGSKVIYLTFDDGPSAYTGKLLDVLKKYDVKVTFFVTGNGPDEMILREYQEGHTVALHTNSHDYCYVYGSVDNYFEDLKAVQDRVKRITGYESKLIRFPGGSSNLVSASCDGGIHIMSILVNEVEKRGFKYFDWNVSSGDAGGTTSSDGVYNNVISTLSSGSSVVLQHDIKDFSVDAVERIIQYGLANGYTFRPLTEVSPGAHHGVNN